MLPAEIIKLKLITSTILRVWIDDNFKKIILNADFNNR